MVNGKNNRRNNNKRSKGGRNAQTTRDNSIPPFSIIPHDPMRIALTAATGTTPTTPHQMQNEAKPAHLAIRTHVKYHVMMHQAFNIQPRPPPVLSRTQIAYESGWIRVQDWDDVYITPLVSGDLHIKFTSRGFVQP